MTIIEKKMIVSHIHRSSQPLGHSPKLGSFGMGMPETGPPGNEQSLCIHMDKSETSPVQTKMPEHVKEMVQAMKSSLPPGMVGPSEVAYTTGEALIVLSTDEYEKWGRPSPGDTVTVFFKTENKE